MGQESVISRDALDSWKAIAAYLQRNVRTVLRWERERGLPVHRIPGGGKPGVYALRSELDTWWKESRARKLEPAEEAAPHRRTPSSAVLPFVNLSAEKENEYFGDGLADETITELTRIHGLRVTVRTSSLCFPRPGTGCAGNRQDTGCQYLAGRQCPAVRKPGSGVGAVGGSGRRIPLWSECYDRELADVFAIQNEISRAIASALEVRLAQAPAARATSNVDAYNLWLKGRYYQQYETLEALAKCRDCLQRAIALDSRFPQPYVGLAELFRAAAHFGTVPPREALIQGQTAIRKALELDPSLGEAHAMSGAYRAWMHFDWEGAKADFDRALELAPGSEQVHRMRATHYLVPTNRLRDAEQEMALAVESDPLSPLASIELGKVLLWERQFDRAQAQMEAAFELRPDYALALWYRGAAWYFQGRIEEAVTFWQSSLRQIGANPAMMSAIGMGLGHLGRRAEARAVLADLDMAGRERYVTPLGRAQVYVPGFGRNRCRVRMARACDRGTRRAYPGPAV